MSGTLAEVGGLAVGSVAAVAVGDAVGDGCALVLVLLDMVKPVKLNLGNCLRGRAMLARLRARDGAGPSHGLTARGSKRKRKQESGTSKGRRGSERQCGRSSRTGLPAVDRQIGGAMQAKCDGDSPGSGRVRQVRCWWCQAVGSERGDQDRRHGVGFSYTTYL